LSTREEHIEQLDALKEGSIDYYAALRSAYYQNRLADIWSRREHRRADWDRD
jgi:ABC-type transporter lipoprotein component MlaA